MKLLFAVIVFFSVVAGADDKELVTFAKEIQRAFESGKQLATNLTTQKRGGECVYIHQPQKSGQSHYTYLNESKLAIERWTKLGKQYLSFGYTIAGRQPAYINDSGDLTLDTESEWYSGQGSDGTYKDIGSDYLRRGTIFGRSAFLYLSKSKTFYNDIEKPAVSHKSLYCYFNEKI